MAKSSKGHKRPRGGSETIHRPEKKTPHRGFLTPLIEKHPVRWAILGYLSFVLVVFASAIFVPDMMVYGTDTMSAGPFFRGLHADSWRDNFEMPLWNPYIHAGLPFVDAMHGDIFYPAAILQIILPVTYALGVKLFLHVFLAGVFMFLFLREIGRTNASAFIGGILYMFAPCMVSLIYPGHDGKMYVTALTPLAFLVLHRAVISRRLSSFMGFGLTYALLILTAHVQMAYYASWALGLYFLFMVWDRYRTNLTKAIWPAVLFTLAVALSLGASSMQWLAPYTYLQKYSQRLAHQEDVERGFEWSSSWSMNSEELMSIVNPEFPGANISYPDHSRDKNQQTYWGQNYFKLNSEAVGVLTFALAIVALIAVRGPTMWFFAGLSVISLLYGMGSSTPVFRIFYEIVPMVKKFRAPSMICFLFAFSWVVMAARAMDALRDYRPSGRPKTKDSPHDPFRILIIVATVYLGITLIALVAGSSFLTGWASFVGNPLDAQKMASLQANVSNVRNGFLLWSFIIWGVVATFYFLRQGKLTTRIVTIILAHLAGIPLVKYDKRFVGTEDPRPYFAERPIVQLIHDNAPDQPYRVFNLRGMGVPGELEDNYLALHKIEEISPSAMHGNHLLTHDIFVGRHDQRPALLTSPATRDLLNVYLMVTKQPIQQEGYVPVGQAGGYFLYRNENAMPRAAVFYQYEVIADTNATLERIRDDAFPYRSHLILDQEINGLPPVADDADTIPYTPARVVERSLNHFVVEYTAERDGLLWLSENYYPAWIATDENGDELITYRADYTFRAIPVKAGSGRIKCAFHSEAYATSLWLSLVCGVVLVGGAGSGLIVRRRKIPLELPRVETAEG